MATPRVMSLLSASGLMRKECSIPLDWLKCINRGCCPTVPQAADKPRA
jgi:hypothetical protein